MSGVEVERRKNLYGFEFRDVDRRRSKPAYNIKQLWQRSHEIINLAAQGFRNSDIAEILNVSPATVSNTLNSDLGEHKLSEIRFSKDEEVKKVTAKIRSLTNKALQIYHQILDDESGECTLKDKKAAADTVVLELSGLRVPTRVQSHNINQQLTKEEIEDFKNRGIEAARESGILVSESESEVE